jgi:hypothetical protein
MELNALGLVSALAAFLSIWGGHVGVRAIEAKAVKLWGPILGALLLGLLFEWIAIRTENPHLSAACGIAGVVFLWDAFEFYRQQERVKRGHAPADPGNPRHARILAEYETASPIDWLDRDPRGRAYSEGELAAMQRETP